MQQGHMHRYLTPSVKLKWIKYTEFKDINPILTSGLRLREKKNQPTEDLKAYSKE